MKSIKFDQEFFFSHVFDVESLRIDENIMNKHTQRVKGFFEIKKINKLRIFNENGRERATQHDFNI